MRLWYEVFKYKKEVKERKELLNNAPIQLISLKILVYFV